MNKKTTCICKNKKIYYKYNRSYYPGYLGCDLDIPNFLGRFDKLQIR